MAESDMHYNETYKTDTSDNSRNVANDGNYGVMIPLPEEGPDTWAHPGYMQPDDRPNPPGSIPGPAPGWPCVGNCQGNISWMPIQPIYPSGPSNTQTNYGQVRFLNASTNGLVVNVTIDGTSYALNSSFGSLSKYDWISDGFHTVSVRNTSRQRTTLLQQTFPFAAGQKVTMVLTDADDGGLQLIRVIDTGCSNLPSNSGCFRFANMSYSGSKLDLMLGNETVFRNISYQSVSSYKQAVAGTYQFTAVTTSSYSFIRELPFIVIGGTGTSILGRENILSFQARIAAGKNYTSYLIGNTWSNANLQVITAED